jgi:hypothetical protein
VSMPKASPRSVASGPAAGVASDGHSRTNNLHPPLPASSRRSPGAASTAYPTSTGWRHARVRLVAFATTTSGIVLGTASGSAGRVDLLSASVGRARSLARSPSPPCRSAGGRGRASTRTAWRPGSSGERQLPSSLVPVGQPEIQPVVPDPTRRLAVDPLSRSTSLAPVGQVTDGLMQAFNDAPCSGVLCFAPLRLRVTPSSHSQSTTTPSPSTVWRRSASWSSFPLSGPGMLRP